MASQTSNWASIALAKLTTDFDKELLLELTPEYFDGVYTPIFKIVQQHFSEHQKLPNIDTLEAMVTAKAPKSQMPIVAGILTAIKHTKVKDISSTEIVKGLRDKRLLVTMDAQIQNLTQAALQKDTEGVRQILNGVVEDVNLTRTKPIDFLEAMEAEDTSKIITSGIDGLDQHLVGMAGLTIVSGASGCVDGDTEFMTRSGWKKISEYVEGDEVLQWEESGATSFVAPQAYIDKPADVFYHLKNKTVDQMLSPEHNMVYHTSRKNHSITHKPMQQVWEEHNNNKAGFNGQFINTFKAPIRNGAAYTDNELRLMVALSADGSIDSRGRLQVTFRLKKESKKLRLVSLLEATKIKYHRNDAEHTGYSQISFRPPKLTKDLTELWEATEEQLKVIYEEFPYWDGSIDKRTGNKRFYTTVKEYADFIQYVINTVGARRCSISVDNRVGQKYVTAGQVYIRKSIAYSVLENNSSVSSVTIDRKKQTKETITRIQPPDGARKYCFTVPSSHFIIRRNGVVVVSSNSGKSAFLLEAAIGQFRAGHSILFVSLELSAQVLGKRLKSSLTGIPFSKIVSDTLNEAERILIKETMAEFFSDTTKSFRIVTTPLDSEELLNLIQVEKSLYNIDVAYIDYLNLIGAPRGGEDGWKNLANTAKALHRLSMEIGVVSVSASQTDLEKAPKGGAFPQIRTRGSAELLFSATLLIYLYKPELDMEGNGENSIILYVMKNRNSAQCQLLMNADFVHMTYSYLMDL